MTGSVAAAALQPPVSAHAAACRPLTSYCCGSASTTQGKRTLAPQHQNLHDITIKNCDNALVRSYCWRRHRRWKAAGTSTPPCRSWRSDRWPQTLRAEHRLRQTTAVREGDGRRCTLYPTVKAHEESTRVLDLMRRFNNLAGKRDESSALSDVGAKSVSTTLHTDRGGDAASSTRGWQAYRAPDKSRL